MSLPQQPPFLITSAISTTLNVSDFYSGRDDGYVISTPAFLNNTLTLSATFANDLWVALNKPKATNLTNYRLYLSIGNGSPFVVANSDSNLDVSNSTTITYNSGNVVGNLQLLLFNLTGVGPATFSVYG